MILFSVRKTYENYFKFVYLIFEHGCVHGIIDNSMSKMQLHQARTKQGHVEKYKI